MIKVFKDKEEGKRKTRVVTIRVRDPQLKRFLNWVSKEKGNLSEFTRQLWKLTAEWDEFKKLGKNAEGEEDQTLKKI